MKNPVPFISLSLALLAAAAARPEEARPPVVTPRPVDEAARSNMLAQTGGPVMTLAAGPALVLVNIQKRVPAARLSGLPDGITRFSRIPAVYREQSGKDAVKVAAETLKREDVAAVIVICDHADHPPMLVAPEARWAVVNVRALETKGVDADALALRLQKEIWRAFAYLMGAAHSTGENCLLKPVLGPADLDALKPRMISPEPLNKISQYATRLGMKPIRMTTYRKACEEGWAPAPTNDVQRAVWDEVKAKAK